MVAGEPEGGEALVAVVAGEPEGGRGQGDSRGFVMGAAVFVVEIADIVGTAQAVEIAALEDSEAAASGELVVTAAVEIEAAFEDI